MELIDFSTSYLKDVIEIEKKSYERPWTEDMFLSSAGNALIEFKIAAENGKTVGYCVFWVVGDETEILNVAVDPQRRRQSFGKKMLEYVLEISRRKNSESVFLEVRRSNIAAISLYKSFGFAEIGVRKKYYVTEDAIILRKELK